MKRITFSITRYVVIISMVIAFSVSVKASTVPNLSLSAVNNNTQVQMTVFGSDPNASVVLYYPSTSSVTSENIGTTNSNGYFTTILSPSVYGIATGASIYVRVNGTQSQIVSWPSVSMPSNTSGSLSLSQSSVSLIVGQGSVVKVSSNISNMGTVTIPSNTNPSVVSSSVSGSQIMLNGLSAGSTNITVCAANVGCTSLYVYVQQPGATQTQTVTSSNSISFSQSTVSMTTGQNQTILLSGPGSFYIPTNSNMSVASGSVNGSSLTINALSAGTATLGVCSAGNNVTSCGSINITVTGSSVSQTDSSTNNKLSFGRNEADLIIGQSVSVPISSSNPGVYYVFSNSNTAVVTANIDGSNVDLTGVVAGGANIRICQLGYSCGDLYVYVVPGSSGVTSSADVAKANKSIALSSFSVSSNNVNNTFLGSGVAITLRFDFNQPISNLQVKVNGNQTGVNGSGSGPYTAIYTLTGSESSPLQISTSFTNPYSQTGQAYFWVGKDSNGVGGLTTNTNNCASNVTCGIDMHTGADVLPAPVTMSSGNSGNIVFTKYLYMNMTPQSVSNPDIVALQNKLKSLGVYSGPVTGYFGPLTKAAVQALQKKNGLDPIGVVGPSTRALLNK